MSIFILKFGNVEFCRGSWYRVRESRRSYSLTKTHYRLDPCSLHKKPTYVAVVCDGVKGRGQWRIIFFGDLKILQSVQDKNGVFTYYKTSSLAIKAADILIAKMDTLKAFI